MKRIPFIAGNWKMNCLVQDTVELITGIKRDIFEVTDVEVAVCPPFTVLGTASELIESSDIKLGSQNIYWEEKGAYTGEIAPQMLKDIGCTYAIIGHSERRKYFAESNEDVNKKIKAALAIGLIPIICVGETQEERESGKMKDVVKDHVQGAVKELSSEELQKCVIAYEPVWAIGTGLTATPDQAQEVHDYIRNTLLADLFNQDTANVVRILYGGSVKPDNIEDLMQKKDIDGALVGGASLKKDTFCEIIIKTQTLYVNVQ